MLARAFITGVSGPTLSAAERSFLREAEPWGFILFTRNIETSRAGRAADRRLPRRCRLTRPCSRRSGRRSRAAFRPATLAALSRRRRLRRSLRSRSCRRFEGGLAWRSPDRQRSASRSASMWIACRSPTFRSRRGDPVIGNRAYGDTPEKVAAIGGAIAAGLMAGGVLPVLKHLPGHGRATADSHLKLPVVDADARETRGDRLRRFPAARDPADGHDRACCVHRI